MPNSNIGGPQGGEKPMPVKMGKYMWMGKVGAGGGDKTVSANLVMDL